MVDEHSIRSLLFAGLLINRDKLPSWLRWLETWSFFHAAFEALLVNEVRYLQLRDHRCESSSPRLDCGIELTLRATADGVDIEVPAATILSMFGFHAQVRS